MPLYLFKKEEGEDQKHSRQGSTLCKVPKARGILIEEKVGCDSWGSSKQRKSDPERSYRDENAMQYFRLSLGF